MNGVMRCTNCGSRFQVIERHGATHVACPRCGEVQVIQVAIRPGPTVEHSAAAGEGGGISGNSAQANRLAEWLACYLPSWGTSVLLHMALLLACMAATWVILQPPPQVDVQADFVNPAPINITNPPQESTPSPYKAQAEVGRFTLKPTKCPMFGLVDNRLKPAELFGVGLGDAFKGGITGWRDDRGKGPRITMFPPTNMTATGKVIYIVDRSGSMTDSFFHVQKQLELAIDNLKATNQFHVIFYGDGPGLEMPARRLLPATVENKQVAFEFIRQTRPEGGTDPSDALDKAFKLKPDIIHLLSDGEFEPGILDQVRRLNSRNLVTVNTICFLYTTGEKILMNIAAENGGTYKYIDERWITENSR